MIVQDLRTIRITIQSIREQTWGHKVRNKRLVVMCREIDRLIDDHTTFNNDIWLWGGQADLRDQLLDGLRALRTLVHPSIEDRPLMAETNREVRDRLRLLEDLATFLIKKAEEIKPPMSAIDRVLREVSSMSRADQPPPDVDEIPF